VPRRLFARLLAHSALVLAAFLAVSWFALDRFLSTREVTTLEEHLTRFALMAKTSLPAGGPALQEAVRRQGEASGIRLTVIDPAGVVLADSEHDPATMENHAGRSEIAAALAGSRGSSIRMSPTLGVEMLYVAVPGPPVLRAALPLSSVRSLLAEIRWRIAWAAVPAAVLALAAALVLSRAITRRFGAMKTFAARVAAGDLSASLPAQGVDEIADLERGLGALQIELNRQMDRLRQDQERLSALVDGLPDGVVLMDGSGRLSVVNEPARELLRLPRESLQGLLGTEALREPQILAAIDSVALGVEGPTPPEPFRLVWPEPTRHLEVTVRPLPDRGTLVVLRDVSRQAHLERVRTDFIANLSHELRTPLTAIRGAAETLLDGAMADPQALDRFLRTIERHALRLQSILSDVSELARIEAGAAPINPSSFDAREPARQVLELFHAEADRAGVTLKEALPAEPVPLVSDLAKVESILVNLVQNAVRYTPSGGAVTVSVNAAGSEVAYAVEDTGIGIPPEEIPRVTERFYRVDPSRSRAKGGTGLGLSIVKHLVEVLGGDLRIESELEKGTRVRVRVPSQK